MEIILNVESLENELELLDLFATYEEDICRICEEDEVLCKAFSVSHNIQEYSDVINYVKSKVVMNQPFKWNSVTRDEKGTYRITIPDNIVRDLFISHSETKSFFVKVLRNIRKDMNFLVSATRPDLSLLKTLRS